MKKEDLISTINSFSEDTSVSFYLSNKGNKDYFFFECNCKNDIQKEIFNCLKDTILEIIKNNELTEFDPVGKNDGVIERLNALDVTGYMKLNNELQDGNNFEIDIKKLGEINFYIIQIKNSNNDIKIFRRYSKSKSLSKGFFMRIFNDNFSKIKEKIFQFDNMVDFLVINDKDIIIFNRYSFELITNYNDNYIINLRNALSIIECSDLIDNIEQFKEDCLNSKRIAKQFTKAMQQNSISLILSNLNKVGEAIREAGLPIEFVNNKFKYENKEQLSILVQLLSDRYAKTLIGEKITS